MTPAHNDTQGCEHQPDTGSLARGIIIGLIMSAALWAVALGFWLGWWG